MLADRSDSRLAQLVAGNVFLVRVANAVLALVTQVLLARWMGSFEFGIYIYVWTWVLMIGALSDVGLSSAARRFIPEYTELRPSTACADFSQARRWLAFGIATVIGLVGALGVTLLEPYLDRFTIIPLYLACGIIPIYGLGASAGRHRAILRLAQSGADAVLHHPPACHHRPDGRGLSVRRADRRGDGDGGRRHHHLGGDHRSDGGARSPPEGARSRPARSITSPRPGSPPRSRSSSSRASTCCSLTSTSWRSSISARPTRSRSTLPARACWRSSLSSISPSPAPPRTSSPNITSPATRRNWHRSSAKPSAGRSGRRWRAAR